MNRTGRIWWWAVFGTFTALGWLWALSLPPLAGPDEPSHVVKAAAVARGDLSTDSDWVAGPLGRVPETTVEVPSGYDHTTLFGQITCWTSSPGLGTACAPPLARESGPLVETTTYVGTYQPPYYAVVGLPTRALAPNQGLYAARFLSAAVVAALVASAVASARLLGGGFVLFAMVLAVTPAVVFLAAAVNPTAVEVAAALALWTTTLALVVRPTVPPRVVGRALVAGLCLLSARPLSPAFAVAIVAAVLVVAGDRDRLAALWRRASVRWATAGLLVALVATVGHVLATDALGSVIEQAQPDDPSVTELFRRAVDQAERWPAQQVGLLSWPAFVELRLPAPVTQLWVAAGLVLVAVACLLTRGRARIGLLLVVAAWLATPVAATVVRPEVGWQGRYALPLGVGIPVLAGWLIDRSSPEARALGARLVAVGAVLSAVILVVAHQLVMGRNLYGQSDLTFAGRDGGLWNGPLSPVVLFVLAVVISAVIAGLGLRASPSARSAGTDDTSL